MPISADEAQRMQRVREKAFYDGYHKGLREDYAVARFPERCHCPHCITDKKLLFACPPALNAARVRENWFTGLTKLSSTFSGARLGVNASICIHLRQFLPAREFPTASLGREERRGTGMERKGPVHGRIPPPSRLNDAAFPSRSARSRSRAAGRGRLEKTIVGAQDEIYLPFLFHAVNGMLPL